MRSKLSNPCLFALARLCVAAVALISLPSPRPCQAQVMVSVGDRVGEAGAVSNRGFEAYCRLLSLDEGQKTAAKDLLDGVHAATRTAADEMRAEMKAFSDKLQESLKKDGWEKAQKMLGEGISSITDKFRDRRRTLEKQFFDDLKGLLTDAQSQKFPAVERHRRRETQLRGAGGSMPDLVEALHAVRVDVAEKSELAGAVEQYELGVDRLLLERVRLTTEQEEKMRKSLGSFDVDAIEKAQEPIRENDKAIRELTRQSAKRFAELLRDDQRSAFELEVKRQEFPRVYRESYAQKAIAAASQFSDLDTSQRDSIARMREQYAREAAPLNVAWAKAIETNQGGNIRMVVQDGMMMENPEKEVDDARKARLDLDESYEKRLKEILKDSQTSRLPEKRPEKPGSGLLGDMEDSGIAVQVMMSGEEIHEGPVEPAEPK